MGQHFSAADTESMFVKLLGRAVKLGFSLRQCFDELDHSGDGEVDASELQAGLIALGGSIPMFKDIKTEDIKALVKHISNNDNGLVTREAFLNWGKRHKLGNEEDLSAPPKKVEPLLRTESTESRAADSDQPSVVKMSKPEEGKYSEAVEEESKSGHQHDLKASIEIDHDIDVVGEYVFSSDPFTAAAERKLRRVAQSFQSRAERLGGWCDVEELFTRYDKAVLGCIMKAEFVNVLMQLGLSLVDIPSGGESNFETNNERQRRLAQLSRVKGGSMDKTARLRAKDAELTRGNKEGDDEELALIKWYREGQKKGLVKHMVEAGVKSEYHIFPRFGSSVFFEHPLVNPFNGEERLMVEIEGSSGLRLLTDFDEWVHFRRHVVPPPGFPHLAASIEPDMFAVDRGGAQLLVGPHETVPLPLAFLSLSESHMSEEHVCVVKLISAKHGVVVALIEVHIHPRAPIINRNLSFNQGEGSIVKRHIRLPPEDSGKFISPVEFGEKRVVVESRVSADGCQEIGIKYAKLSGFPSSGDFYLIIFDDEYRSKLYELWHVVVSSRLRKDVHGAVGVASSLELVVRGERQERLVKAFSTNRGEISFHPQGPFVLHPNVYNQISLTWLPKEAGTTTEHVHLVDMETNQLVVAWLVSTVATPPQVSKEFDVDVVVGEASHKRVSYNNPWSRAQAYTLRSSDPNRMRPKTNRLHIDAHGQAYIRLYIAPVERAGVSEVFLLVNDEQDQNDECFRIIIRADA
jgi:nephrocystin-4